MSETESMRLDKWLWCARFYKTRSLAVEEIGKGRVTVNNANAKASREIRPGDHIHLRQGNIPREVIVRGLSGMRGPAPWPSSSTRKQRKALPSENSWPSSAAWHLSLPMHWRPSTPAVPPSVTAAKSTACSAAAAGATAGAPPSMTENLRP